MIIDIPELTYMCPACGNYFYNSGVRSYTIFGSIRYSDGVSKTNYDPFWITQCPKCTQYVAHEHLFRLPFPVSVDLGLDEPAFKKRYTVKGDEKYGRIEFFGYGDGRMELIEKILAQGQYFPITVSEATKKWHRCLLYRDLWHEYNMHRDKISDEVYYGACKELIGMLEGRTDERFRVTLAELYRNIGEFEKCLAILDCLHAEKMADTVERIREEALKGNTLTVVVEDTRE
jgi:hypothetical protein